ncbi:MAG: hypothetical protein AAGL96_15400, partial [Pseudomonadota bacterium]
MHVTVEKYVLFTDVVESVRLFDIDADATSQAINDLLKHLNSGSFADLHKIEKVSGDGLILTTLTADHAVQIALEIGQRLSTARLGSGGQSISVTSAITSGAFIVGD